MAKIKNNYSNFPSQAVSDSEKKTVEYGTQVAKAIEQEWFNSGRGSQGRYYALRDEFHRLRLYARGEQSIRKYKDEFAINGDLSYLNLDWKPVPIIPKFIDIVVNGMQDRLYNVRAVGEDPISTGKRTKYVEGVQRDMNTNAMLDLIEAELGTNVRNIEKEKLPGSSEELDLFMQLNYKQGIEIAQEQAISNIFNQNKYEYTKSRVDYDIAVLGIGAARHSFNNTDGVKLDYVDPANLIWSYTEDPYFQDCYYFGEIKSTRVNELKKQFPSLSNEDIEDLSNKSGGWNNYSNNYSVENTTDSADNSVNVLYFNWKTWENNVYKIKEIASGAEKAIEKDDSFDPPKDKRTRFERVAKAQEVIYEGVYILGANKLLKWKKASNMIRPHSNANKVLMNYVVAAPRIYKGKIDSLVAKMTPYADLIQLTHLKLQQAIQRMTPSGVYIDADGLAEIDLGNGTSYNPQEALNMYFQTGSIIGRSLTVEGDPNPGKVPIQELPGGGGNQVQLLIGAYNQYLQMIRDITGLNEARDGSDPDPKALVGVQKMAAANSNVATRHILESSLFITKTLAEAISLRFKDILEFHPTRDMFISSLGQFSVGSLKELENLHLHDFGIFLDLQPDEIEKQSLENNIQVALAQQSIFLEDAIDIREVRNIKLANQLLKFRRLKKQMTDQQAAQAAAVAQAEAQGKAQIEIENAKAQAQQVKSESAIQISTAENELSIKKLQFEAETKKQLMQFEYDLNVKLKELELSAQKELVDKQSETQERIADKKISVSSISGPPKTEKPKQSFESKGNDVLGGFDLSRFEPK
jgi:hypothetical protein